MYKKSMPERLSCLPRSVLLKEDCTVCGPGIDTGSGWTRAFCASPVQEHLQELQPA